MEQNLQIISDMLEKLDTKSSMDEFVKAFELIVEYIKSEKDITEGTLREVIEKCTNATEDLVSQNKENFSVIKAELLNTIQKGLAEVRDGTDGAPGPQGIPGPQGEGIPGTPGKDGSPDTPTQVRDKLESLSEDEKLPIVAIKGLTEALDELRNRKPQLINVGGTAGRDVFQDIDISSQLDGLTKTFNIQAIWRIISVDLSGFPYGSCRKNIDYTWTPTSITFTDQIDASTQLASGQTCILTVVTSP